MRRVIACTTSGDVRLRQLVHAHRQVERLTLVRAHEALGESPVRFEPRGVVQRGAAQERVRPEVEPVARVERHRHPVAPVQRGRAATRRRVVLDVVDDERAGVQDLDQKRQLARRGAGAAAHAEAELEEARADPLARAAQELAQRIEQRVAPQRRRYADGGARAVVDRALQQADEFEGLRRRGGRRPHDAFPSASAFANEKPRGGRPTTSRARSNPVVASA